MKHRRIIAGLGNPGPLFAKTYHNVGVLALDALARGADFKAYKSLFEYAPLRDSDIVLIKPLVFMNESGKALTAAAKMFGAGTNDITVIHDDSDIATGEVKFSSGQSAAGHRGVQSVIDALGSKEFGRVRIGIRNKNEKRRKKAAEFVLKPIKPSDRKPLKEVFEKIALALEGAREGHRE